jgi:hypothetical protein
MPDTNLLGISTFLNMVLFHIFTHNISQHIYLQKTILSLGRHKPINRYLLQRDFLGLALAGPFYTTSSSPGYGP